MRISRAELGRIVRVLLQEHINERVRYSVSFEFWVALDDADSRFADKLADLRGKELQEAISSYIYENVIRGGLDGEGNALVDTMTSSLRRVVGSRWSSEDRLVSAVSAIQGGAGGETVHQDKSSAGELGLEAEEVELEIVDPQFHANGKFQGYDHPNVMSFGVKGGLRQ